MNYPTMMAGRSVFEHLGIKLCRYIKYLIAIVAFKIVSKIVWLQTFVAFVDEKMSRIVLTGTNCMKQGVLYLSVLLNYAKNNQCLV